MIEHQSVIISGDMVKIQKVRLTSIIGDYCDCDGKELSELDGLSRVNFFVGPNNSGKSRLLRALASCKSFYFHPDDFTTEQYLKWEGNAARGLENLLDESDLSQVGPLHQKILSRDDFGWLPLNQPKLVEEREDFWRVVSLEERYDQWGGKGIDRIDKGEFVRKATHLAVRPSLGKLAAYSKQLWNRAYLPVLRGLRPVGPSGENNDPFERRTRDDYFGGEGEYPLIFTGQQLYRRTQELLLGPPEDRERIRQFEDFLSHSFFQGQPISIVPRLKKDVLHIRIGGENEYPIHALGDGIQTIIILTFSIFTEDRTLFFIEEPETHLHPGMQRQLLEVLSRHDKHQYYIATHSNHLLDMTADYADSTSVFLLRKLTSLNEKGVSAHSRFIVERVSAAERNTLTCLGVRDSSVFRTNATIWVEGITDRLYIRHLLHLYQTAQNAQSFREDTHYSFVEYGGSNLVHFSFFGEEDDDRPIEVERLCGKAMVIADTDASDWKEDRAARFSKELGVRFVRTPGREIENTLPETVILEVIRDYENEEQLDLPELKREDYRDSKLGEYIDLLIPNGKRKRKSTYGGEGGVLKDKVAFCRKALKYLSSLEELDEDVVKFVEDIFAHVRRQNEIAPSSNE